MTDSVKPLLECECYKPGMFTLFPGNGMSAWLAQNGWWLILATVVIVAVGLKALRDGTTVDACNPSDLSDSSSHSCGND